MKLEVLLTEMNLDKKDLNKKNITSKCTVINQCGKESFEKHKNFNIYSYNELGASNSRNRGLSHVKEDFVIFCDDDVIYNDNYEKLILDEFKNNPKADAIIFNFNVLNRKKRIIKKRKRLHIYSILNYATYNIAFKRSKIINNNIRFNPLFGPGAKYKNGDDSLFLVNMLRKKLKIYSSPVYLGTVYNDNSTWSKNYDYEYIFNKGAIFTAINPKLRHLLCFQYLIRHREVLVNYNLFSAYKIMLKGSRDYLDGGKK